MWGVAPKYVVSLGGLLLYAQYRNSQFSKLVDNMPIPVNPLEAVVQ